MTQEFIAELPAGGTIHLQSEDELNHWNELKTGFQRDYRLIKVNDLTNLGTLLIHHMTLFRAQRRLAGMEPQIDDEGLPTGRFTKVEVKDADRTRAIKEITEASKEIRNTEAAMGIDKKSREASGPQTMVSYIETMKRLAHDYGVHINQRVQALEEFRGELSWRVRLEQQGDVEDKAYMEATPEQILAWIRAELAKLEESDKEFAEHQALVMGGRGR